MILGIATSHNRISPVFDCAEHFSIYCIKDKTVEKCEECRIPATSYSGKLATLDKLGVECIICGAISRELHDIVRAYGIDIMPWISGQVEEVLSAFCNDRIADRKFLMPGCMRRQKQCKCHNRLETKQD